VGKVYSDEVSYIPQTLQWAVGQDIDRLRKCVRSCANRSVIAIGSGGSFTAAAYVASLHEPLMLPLPRRQEPAFAGTALKRRSAGWISGDAERKTRVLAFGSGNDTEFITAAPPTYSGDSTVAGSTVAGPKLFDLYTRAPNHRVTCSRVCRS
jgi:hypothetical protein